MDQVRIGQFIQTLRKEKNITQKDLASIVSVSDKTVSKWENGNGLPDIPNMLTLCEYFGISINELLACERLLPNEYSKKAEDNIMALLQANTQAKKKGKLQLVIGIALFLLALLTLAISNYGISFWENIDAYWDGIAFAVLFLAIGACVLLLGVKDFLSIIISVQNIVLPISGIIALCQIINAFHNGTDANTLYPALAVGLLPLLYGVITYFIAKIVNIKIKGVSNI